MEIHIAKVANGWTVDRPDLNREFVAKTKKEVRDICRAQFNQWLDGQIGPDPDEDLARQMHGDA